MGGERAAASLASLNPGFTLQIFALPYWAVIRIRFSWDFGAG